MATVTSSARSPFGRDPLAFKARKLHQREKELDAPTSRVLDVLFAVDPAKKKLTSVETRRIIAVLEEGMRRIEIVSLLPFITRSLSRFAVLLGSDLTRLLERHALLEEEYRHATSPYRRNERPSGASVLASPSRAPSFSQDFASSIDDETREKIADLTDELRQSVRNVLRAFARNPTAANAMRAESKERSAESGLLLETLSELKSTTKERLATTRQEENDRGDYLSHVAEREEKARAEIRNLEEELGDAIAKRQKEISEKEAIARKLETDLHSVQKLSQENDRHVMTEAEKQETTDLKSHEIKRAKVEQQVAQLKKTLADNRTSHREAELNLRKRKFKVEHELENWIREYDNDMGDRQEEMEGVQKVYDEQRMQLNELEERFATLEVEYNRVVEERRIAKEKAEEAQRELEKMIRAATLLQSLWRSYKCRKLLKQKQKKGKKGKKGKGKGKKSGKKKRK